MVERETSDLVQGESVTSTPDFWNRIDAVVKRIVDSADPWDVYALAMDVAAEAVEDMQTVDGAGAVYIRWMDLSDLFDDVRLGVVPPEGAKDVVVQAAKEWLATPATKRVELIEEWRSRDLVAMVREAGFEVGPPPNSSETDPWLGRWDDIAWVIGQIGVTHTAYAAGERVLREIRSSPVLWQAASGQLLEELLGEWETDKARRPQLADAIGWHVRSLRAEDVPPLR